jgi:hypothetical protein
MFMFNGTLDMCARTAQAAKGTGTFGGRPIQMDEDSSLTMDGEYQGRVMNPSGTYGSLSQRCNRGDTDACELWGEQSEMNSRRMQQMYPRGWNR